MTVWKRIGAGAALALGLATGAQAQGAETVVATVNGTDITLGQLSVMLDDLPPQYQALPDDVLFNGLLEQMIQQTVLQQQAEPTLSARDRVTIQNQRTAYIAGTALQALVGAAVTDAALQAAYDERYANAAPQTEYNAAHILVETEDKARDLKAQIDGGADFAELARQHSTDGAAASGGDLGWFGLGMMVKPFEDAVVALQPGQVGGPVQTQFGWHLVLLKETRAAQVPTLDEVRDELAAELEQAAIETLLADLTAKAAITRAEGIDPARLRDQTLFDN